jgi:hypothetical protein
MAETAAMKPEQEKTRQNYCQGNIQCFTAGTSLRANKGNTLWHENEIQLI